jgi:hypothetical protein
MAYRAIRREVEVDGIIYNPWCCYHFNNYREVPQNRRANRNTRVLRGNVGLLGDGPFATAFGDRHGSLIEFLNKFAKQANKKLK